MSATSQNSKIAFHSKDTGIPQKELVRMCIRAGLELLEKGELKISAIISPSKNAEKEKGAAK